MSKCEYHDGKNPECPMCMTQQMDQAAGSALWAVMKAHTWGSISAHGFPLQCPPEGPHRFIPVFNTREQAVAWDGSDEHVARVMMNAKLSDKC